MAIVVKTSPGNFISVHGDMLFVVNEAVKTIDPVTYPDYRYIADVYVDTELVTRLKAYPQPDTKMGVFNISNILRNYISPVFNPTANVLRCQTLNTGDFNVSGTVVFGEEYGFTLYPGLVSAPGRKYFGHYNGRLLGSLTNLSDYYGKIASARPDITKIYRNANFCFIPYFENTNGVDVTISSYREDGSLVSSYTSLAAGIDQAMHLLNFAPSALNAAASPTVLIDDTVVRYTINFTNNSNRLLTFELVCEPKFTVYTLHFLNRFGGFESRDFTKLSRKVIDIEKKDFGKLPYTVNASGEVSYHNSNNVYNETRSIYASQYKEKMVLNTDVLNDAEYTWLGDLILSPMVYLEMDGYFIPIVITQNNYEFRKSINDKITNLTLSIEFGDQFNAQYR